MQARAVASVGQSDNIPQIWHQTLQLEQHAFPLVTEMFKALDPLNQRHEVAHCRNRCRRSR